MKLSVALITYNHRPFIEQSIDSVLCQEVDGEWEIVIGDDASDDGTTEILSAYANRHPEKIRLFTRESNAGDRGRSNFLATLSACRGEYIAYLDGDDYWLGRSKLARQIELLDSQPGLSACVHPVLRVYPDGSQDAFGAIAGNNTANFSTISRNFSFVHCSSLVYRKSALPRFPDWFADERLRLDDWALTFLCTRQGEIGCINEVMGVYRKHENGIWSGQSVFRRLLWDLDTRSFVYGQAEPPPFRLRFSEEAFDKSMTSAWSAVNADKPFSSRVKLSFTLLSFPWKRALSFKYYIMFLVEVWAAFSKPYLNRLRRLF